MYPELAKARPFYPIGRLSPGCDSLEVVRYMSEHGRRAAPAIASSSHSRTPRRPRLCETRLR
eukprot:scaffold180464_cov16-Prasinocladus_malaysianus.AAC.1